MRSELLYALSVVGFLVFAPVCLYAQTGDATAGSKIFATNCAGCHGSDGHGGERAPNIATVRNIVSLTDTDLGNFVRNGVSGSGMPAFGFLGDNGIRDVVAFLRQLQGKTSNIKVTGNEAKGRELFFGQPGCSTCHMMHGQGGFIASDLSDYGNGTAPERIRMAILGPEAFVPPGSEVVEVTTASGELLHGVLRSENNFIIVLQLEDGRYRRLEKATLRKLLYTGHSLMPTDYGSRLSSVQIDNIITYLVRSANPIDPARSRRGVN